MLARSAQPRQPEKRSKAGSNGDQQCGGERHDRQKDPVDRREAVIDGQSVLLEADPRYPDGQARGGSEQDELRRGAGCPQDRQESLLAVLQQAGIADRCSRQDGIELAADRFEVDGDTRVVSDVDQPQKQALDVRGDADGVRRAAFRVEPRLDEAADLLLVDQARIGHAGLATKQCQDLVHFVTGGLPVLVGRQGHGDDSRFLLERAELAIRHTGQRKGENGRSDDRRTTPLQELACGGVFERQIERAVRHGSAATRLADRRRVRRPFRRRTIVAETAGMPPDIRRRPIRASGRLMGRHAQPAGHHAQQRVRIAVHQRLAMRGENDGGTEPVQLCEQAHQPCGIRGIGVARRLVGEQEPWPADDGTGNADHLALAHREAGGKVFQLVPEAEPAQHVGHELDRLALVGTVDAQRQRHVVEGRQVLEQLEILKHHTDALAKASKLITVDLVDS